MTPSNEPSAVKIMGRWRRRAAKEEAYYEAQRRLAEGQVSDAEPDPGAWMAGSVGAWLPAEKRAAYLAELRGES